MRCSTTCRLRRALSNAGLACSSRARWSKVSCGWAAAKAAQEIAKRRKFEVREYKNAKEFEKDAKKRMRAGWELQGQTQVGSHDNLGRTAAKAVAFTALVGPLGLLAAGSRTNGGITVTWITQA